jgi:ubiquinone/menaquinone biosynthesis C-methylase UbiE
MSTMTTMSTSAVERAPQIFQREYYQRLYDIEEQHWWAKGMRDAMDALLSQPLKGSRKLKVLDIGCGTGLLMNYLKKKYPIDGPVVGLDISEHALEFCEQRGEKKLLLGSATSVPLPSRSVDLIICIDTIQHLSPAGADLEAIFEFSRLLEKDGLLYLRTNSRLGHVQLAGADADQYRRYDIPTVGKMLRLAGFKVERSTYLNMLPSAAGAVREFFTAARNHEHHHHSEAIGPGLKIKNYKSGMNWLNSLMHFELQCEAALMGMGVDLPFGHSCGFVARKQ